MLPALQRYSRYLTLTPQQQQTLISQAKIEQSQRAPNPQGTYKFAESNFVSLDVFDSVKQESMYRLKTYRQEALGAKPKAVVALFHGLHSHVQRGAHIAHYLAEKGITTVGYDYRGFGQSEGSRGYISDFKTHLSDAEKFIGLVKQIYPTTPLFAMGLSLGGATAYELTRKHRQLFTGAILQAPALMPALHLSNNFSKLTFFLRFLEYFLPSELKLIPGNIKAVSRNPKVVEDTLADELFIKNRIKLRTINSLFQIMQNAQSTFKDYDLPFLVVQGGKDKLIDPNVAFALYSQSKTPQKDKQLLFYEDMWHNVWHEQQIHDINLKTSEWILSRS